MLLSKTNPTGADWYIQQLQTKLHTRLIGEDCWNLSDPTKYKAYGRAYRNKNDNGYIAENYEGDGNYQEVYYDNSLAAISWFGMGESIRAGAMYEANVHLVFFTNLDILALRDADGNLIAHRADEEVRQSVLEIIGKGLYGFTVEGIILGIDNVLREYPGSRRENRLNIADIHPGHCFRINLKLTYNPNKNC